MNPLDVNRNNIWNYKQNNPELVVQDIKEYLNLTPEQCDGIRKILMARGVNKWFKVRRDLIAYKKIVKKQLMEVEVEKIDLKEKMKVEGFNEKLYRQFSIKKEVMKTLMNIRGTLKKMCMTDRWQQWKPSTSTSVLREMNTIKCSGE